MRGKYRMREERGGAFQFRRQRLARAAFDLSIAKRAAEGAPYRLDHRRRRGLMQRDPERGLADAQIDAFGSRAGHDLVALRAGLHGDGIAEIFAPKRKAEPKFL